MKNPAFALLLVLATLPAWCQQLTLKCQVVDSKSKQTFESWIVVDQQAGTMRVRGKAQELEVTNEHYSSRSAPSGSFRTSTTLNRSTGSLRVVETYEGKVVWVNEGVCEKAEPPATKF
jgi:uncharacterized protein YjdB